MLLLLLLLLLLLWWLLWLDMLLLRLLAKSDSTDVNPRTAAAPLIFRGTAATGTVLEVEAGELVGAVDESRSEESSEDAIAREKVAKKDSDIQVTALYG